MKLIREFDDFDWIRDTTPNFDENNTPGVGDVLVCLPGYHNSPSEPYNNEIEDPNCAGAGYADGRIIVVEEVDVLPDVPEGKRLVIWPDEDESQMYWDDDDGDGCFDCGIYGFALTYYTETLNESEEDDFDWTNNTLINPWELGYDLVFFDKVPTRKDVEELIEMALTSRNLNSNNKKGWLKTDTRNAIIRKIINRANLNNRGVYLIYDEDMDRLLWGSGTIAEEHNKINYSNLVETNLTESIDDFEWSWTKDPINPWLEYDGIIFDIEPRRDEVNEYIEMALRTRDDIVNKDSWTTRREDDISDIINYQKKYNHCILGVDSISCLTYGTSGGYYSNRRLVNYSQLIGMEPLMESDDPLQWIRDIQPPTFKDAVIGQTYDITTKSNLFKAIKACGDNEEVYLSKRAEVRDKDNLLYNNIFCGHEREDIVPVLLLKFLDEEGWNISYFWVTEDMVQLH